MTAEVSVSLPDGWGFLLPQWLQPCLRMTSVLPEVVPQTRVVHCSDGIGALLTLSSMWTHARKGPVHPQSSTKALEYQRAQQIDYLAH